MAAFLRHEACPECGSSDALAIYAEGGGSHCFSCNYTIPSEEYIEAQEDSKPWYEKYSDNQIKVKSSASLTQAALKESMQEISNDIKNQKPSITDEENIDIKERTTVSGVGFRGIRDDVYKIFGVRHSINADTGEVYEQYYPVTSEGQLTGYKIREVPKNFRSKGRTGADCDLFMSFRFNRGGKYLLITEGECLLPSTKVLTRSGWVALRDYNESHGEVMQGDGTFAKPIAKVYKAYNSTMLSYNSGSYSIDLTPEHNMIRLDASGDFVKVKASDVTKKNMPVPRVVDFKSDSDNLRARLQVMFSADFTFRDGGDIYGCLKKERKIERAKYLLNKAGVRYTVNLDSRGYSSFFIHRGHGLDVSKEFVYERDISSASTIIDEVVHWDGNSVPNRNQIEYSTVIRNNAEFIQTCSHLCGFTSSIIPRSRDKYNWFKVSILFGKKTSSTQKGYQEYNYHGYVACLTMPNGSLLVKQNDSISVTGNCDSLSAYQMISDYNKQKGSDFETAVVSPTTGAQSKKQIANNYKFIDSFDQVILCMDSDDAGQKAAQELVKYLPKGKVKMMQMRFKDANEYLQKGKQKEFISDFYNAKSYVPVGIVPSNQISDAMRAELKIPKIPLPPFMHKLQDMMAGGIPLGRAVNLGSASGTGKSTIIDEIIYFLIFNSPHKCGIVTMESTVGQYGIKLLSRHISKKVELMQNDDALAFIDSDVNKSKEHDLFNDQEGNPRFYLVDDRDGGTENVKQAVENLVISCGCRVIVLDPLHDVIASLPLEEQEKFMAWQKGLMKSHSVTFLNVAHTRKTSGGQKAGSTGADLHEEDILGNSAIYKSAACNLMFTRNKESEDELERNTTIMKATKIRWTGKTGIAGKYYYDNEKHTLYDLDDYMNDNGLLADF